VLGCDGQPTSDAAIRFAVREARLRRARLVVVIAYFIPVDPDLESIETPDSVLRSRARTRAEVAMCRALTLPIDQLPQHEIVTEPGPAGRILRRDYDTAQLIVIGTHQRHLLQRLLHGQSTSRDLIEHSNVPVVVVPPAASDLNASSGPRQRLPT
jgi:nucleotide-binding universal stress UspA family protein